MSRTVEECNIQIAFIQDEQRRLQEALEAAQEERRQAQRRFDPLKAAMDGDAGYQAWKNRKERE